VPAKRKPEGALARPRERKGANAAAPAVIGERKPVRIPAADPNWHPIAKRMYNSYRSSGQSDLWQNSDWAFAYSLCDDLSRYKNQEDGASSASLRAERWYELDESEREAEGFDKKRPPHVPKGGSAMKMNAIMDALGRLGTTEADRLKVRIELTDPAPETTSASVVAISDYQKALGVAE
jgi:hypothetical protein